MIDVYKLKNCRALVVGDIMLDCYKMGSSTRLSPEAPVPVVLIDDSFYTLGGAANVALNLSSLGCKVDLMGCIGSDTNGKILSDILSQQKIGWRVSVLPDVITTCKTRIIGNDQHLVRYDVERKINWLIQDFNPLKEHYDVVLISDYDKGVISQYNMNVIREIPNAKIVADFKPRNKKLFHNIFCISPNYFEAQNIAQDDTSSLEDLARTIKRSMNLESIIITLSNKGVFLMNPDESYLELPTHCYQPPKERHHRLDVSGAGDTLLSVFAAAVACGNSLNESVALANVAASIVVTKIGTCPCGLDELNREYTNFLGQQQNA